MQERGFHESFRRMKSDEVHSITFVDEDIISCTVTLDDDHFQFTYLVPHSVNQLQSPDCGSVMNDGQFNMIFDKFRMQARVLKQHC